MNEQMKENISVLMDGESQDEVTLKYIQSDDAARRTWERYHLISDVLKNRYEPGSYDLSQRVHAALEQEDTFKAKIQRSSNKIRQQIVGLAMAATVAAVAIVVVRDVPQEITPQGSEIAVAPTSQSVQPVTAIGPITDKSVRLTTAGETKLSGYIVSHNEFSASTRIKAMPLYSRIVGYAPGQVVSQRSGVNVEK